MNKELFYKNLHGVVYINSYCPLRHTACGVSCIEVTLAGFQAVKKPKIWKNLQKICRLKVITDNGSSLENIVCVLQVLLCLANVICTKLD
jgi:hypothetical protein